MAGKIRTILLVDDEQDNLKVCEAILSELAQVRFVTARDGEQALLSARAEKPDLIVLDVMMPVKDGLTTLAELKAGPATKSIPVILFSGMSMKTGVEFTKADLTKFAGVEPDAYVRKPVTPEVLLATAERLLG